MQEPTDQETMFLELHDQAAGMMDVHLITPDLGAELLEAAVVHKDVQAWNFLRLIKDACERVARAPEDSPVLCMCCPRAVRKTVGATFGIVIPAVEEPTVGLGFVLCSKCSASSEKTVVQGLRRIWPNARSIVQTHVDGGRA